jgi:hypothetical protein
VCVSSLTSQAMALQIDGLTRYERSSGGLKVTAGIIRLVTSELKIDKVRKDPIGIVPLLEISGRLGAICSFDHICIRRGTV